MISVILRIENIGPILLCVLSGPVSDRFGRRLPLLVSCLGMLASYTGYFALSVLDPEHKLSRLYYILPSIGISVGGQFFVFFQMFFAFTSDVSELNRESADYKFRRFIIAEGSVYFGAVTGSYVGGLMYSKVGYSNVFLASILLMIGSWFEVFTTHSEGFSFKSLRLHQDEERAEAAERGEPEACQSVRGDLHRGAEEEAGQGEVPRPPRYSRVRLVRNSVPNRR